MAEYLCPADYPGLNNQRHPVDFRFLPNWVVSKMMLSKFQFLTMEIFFNFLIALEYLKSSGFPPTALLLLQSGFHRLYFVELDECMVPSASLSSKSRWLILTLYYAFA